MVIQLEDYVDVLKHLYLQYDFLFLFDHSSGHDKQRDNGLNLKIMTTLFGGSQRKMREPEIKKAYGYLGTYHHNYMLKVGEIQSMVFQVMDKGLFLDDRRRMGTLKA